MRAFGVLLAGFAAFAFSFVCLHESILAQDAKDEKKTEEKKSEEKKDDEKKVEKKVVVRMPEASEVNRAKKKMGKVKDIKADDPAEIVIVLADLSRLPEYREWE